MYSSVPLLLRMKHNAKLHIVFNQRHDVVHFQYKIPPHPKWISLVIFDQLLEILNEMFKKFDLVAFLKIRLR